MSVQEYDRFRRPAESWLPFPKTGNKGALITGDVSSTVKTTYGDDNPYGLPVYENDISEKVIQAFSPGSEVQSSGRATQSESLVNDESSELSCKWYKAEGYSFSVVMARNNSGNNIYPTGYLTVNKVTDEDELPFRHAVCGGEVSDRRSNHTSIMARSLIQMQA